MIDANSSEQPEILEAHWDLDQVDALLDDLQRGANVQHVQIRTSSDGRPEDRGATLQEAQGLLHAGEAKAIQIRYTFEQETWCDTLMVLPDSIRIIRMRGNISV